MVDVDSSTFPFHNNIPKIKVFLLLSSIHTSTRWIKANPPSPRLRFRRTVCLPTFRSSPDPGFHEPLRNMLDALRAGFKTQTQSFSGTQTQGTILPTKYYRTTDRDFQDEERVVRYHLHSAGVFTCFQGCIPLQPGIMCWTHQPQTALVLQKIKAQQVKITSDAAASRCLLFVVFDISS